VWFSFFSLADWLGHSLRLLQRRRGPWWRKNREVVVNLSRFNGKSQRF
jgi:hypothetical protein